MVSEAGSCIWSSSARRDLSPPLRPLAGLTTRSACRSFILFSSRGKQSGN